MLSVDFPSRLIIPTNNSVDDIKKINSRERELIVPGICIYSPDETFPIHHYNGSCIGLAKISYCLQTKDSSGLCTHVVFKLLPLTKDARKAYETLFDGNIVGIDEVEKSKNAFVPGALSADDIASMHNPKKNKNNFIDTGFGTINPYGRLDDTDDFDSYQY